MKQPALSFYLMGGLSLFVSIGYFFGILTEARYSAAFILWFFAGIYFAMGFVARKRFSIVILISYIAAVTIQMGYFIYLEDRFTPVPIVAGIMMIYEVIQDYKNGIKNREKTQQVGDL